MTLAKDSTPNPASLWNRQFVVLMAVTFLTYANISVFFQFYDYLEAIAIPPQWTGVIISTFAAVSLLVRPLVSPVFNAGNARPFLMAGTAMIIIALGSYSLTQSLAGLLAVRVFHGLAFVVMGSALTALMVQYVPQGGSAQFFGYLSIIILIPNTLVPSILPYLNRLLGGFQGVLLGFAALTGMIFFMLPLLNPAKTGPARADAHKPLTWPEIRENLTDKRVLFLLLAMLLMYCGHAVIFFFLSSFGRTRGIIHAGLFLTLATAGEILVRVIGGSYFDRMNKARLLGIILACLALAYAFLAGTGSLGPFLAMGAIFGLGWGIALPVFNGFMFDLSRPKFQSMNTNLGMQMFQAGFFLGPFIGAAVIPPWGFGALFYLCAAFSLSGAVLLIFTGGLKKNEFSH
jgi:predicted MFS family arabinose efflux permease